jgi:hypothetical protein
VVPRLPNQATLRWHLHQPNEVHSRHSKKFGMKDTKLIKTPMGTNGHLDLDTRGIFVDQKVY